MNGLDLLAAIVAVACAACLWPEAIDLLWRGRQVDDPEPLPELDETLVYALCDLVVEQQLRGGR